MLFKSTQPAKASKHLSLGSKSKTGPIRVKDHILALKEDITKDRESQSRVTLDPAVAGRAALLERGIVDHVAGDDGSVVTDLDFEIGQFG